MPPWRRLEQPAIGVVAVSLVIVATLVHGWPTTVLGQLYVAAVVAAGLSLMWWRSHPRQVVVVCLGLLLVPVALQRYGWFPDTALVPISAPFAVLALAWSSRAAWLAALAGAAYVAVWFWATGATSWVACMVFTVPPYLAGLAFRLRRQTADELELRARELEEERELFAALALRHERARIASELHDIVGHAISVMVVQAAAGQRLVDRDPERARRTFDAIADSARQGKQDLQRLVDLLGGTEVGGPDLALIDEMVLRAARSGLDVRCRFEGDRDGVAAPTAHVAFRVVQESLTNALRHAPGAAVRVLVRSTGRDLTVRVENDRPTGDPTGLGSTGLGLTGLRERVRDLGGQLLAGPTPAGGWLVEASVPRSPAPSW